VRGIVAQQLGELPVTVWLFGSRARGDHRPASDAHVLADWVKAMRARA